MPPFRGGLGGGGELESVLSFRTHTPLSLTERVARAPFSRRAFSHCRGAGPRSSALGPRLSGRSRDPAPPSLSRAEGALVARRERSSRRPVALYVPALRPSRPRPSPVPRPGRRNPRRQTHPARRAYLPVLADGLAAGALQPSFFPFPRAASLLLPPAGWVPPPPLPDGSPAHSPAA